MRANSFSMLSALKASSCFLLKYAVNFQELSATCAKTFELCDAFEWEEHVSKKDFNLVEYTEQYNTAVEGKICLHLYRCLTISKRKME